MKYMSGRSIDYIKKVRRWIYIAVSVIVLIAASLSAYYYFSIYLLKPNFDDTQFSFVYSDKGGHLKPGEEITYIVNYGNTGNRDVKDLVIEAEVPEHTFFISSDRSDILISDENTLDFKVGDVRKNEKGSLYFVARIEKPLDNSTEIRLDQVKFKYKAGKDVFNDVINTSQVNIIDSNPDLNNFDLKAYDENGDILRLGEIIKYYITVENTGDMDASNVEIRSDLSEYVDLVGGSITGSGEYKDGYILWDQDKIEINKPETFSFKVRLKEDLDGEELITNKSTLKYGSNIIEKSAEKKLSLFSDFTTSEASMYDVNGRGLWPGETISVKIVVRNTGEKKEANYSVICPIPAEATYIKGTGNKDGIRWSDDIRGLIWDLKDIGIGEEKELTFKMRVNNDLANKGGVVTIHFKIKSSKDEVELPSKSLNVSGFANVTIVAIGDSLIEMSNWVQTFDYLLEANYPYADYNTIASGKGGEMARDGYARFDSSVSVHNPDIVIIAYGTNDAGTHFSSFSANLEGMVIKAKKLGARVFINLIGPIYKPEKADYVNKNETIKVIAARNGAVVIDVMTPLSQNPGAYLVDGMHYSGEGAVVVAHTVFSYVSNYLGTIGQRL
jgi:uncharacterized repeat protein (TIGR01451 family)